MNGGEPALIDTGNGFTVKYRGRYLYALNDPIKKVEQKLKHLDIKQNTLIFLPGLALGYGFKELLKLLPQHCHVLCVEIDQKIMNLALSRGLKSLLKDNRLTILRSQDPLKAIEVLNTIGMGEYRRVKTITLCGGYQLFPEQYKKISQALETAINSYWQNRMTLIHMGKLLVKNIFSNLHLLSKSIDIYQLRTAKPLVVLGAGPSLEDTLPIIKRIRKQIQILAVDTALPVLMEEAIKPDYLCVLESQFINIEDFIRHHDTNIRVLCDITAAPQVMRLFNSKLYIFSSHFYGLQLWQRMKQARVLPHQIPALGSVGVTALYLALQITNGLVLFAGLDYCYNSGKTHARGAPFNQLLLNKNNRFYTMDQRVFSAVIKRPLLRLHDKKGNKVLSDLILNSYARDTQNLLQSQKRVYDMGKLGLALGVKQIDEKELQQILLKAQNQKAEKLVDMHIGFNIEDIKEFIINERDGLEKVIDLLRKKIDMQDKTRDEFTQTELKRLKAVDYIYFYLPDKIDFLKCKNSTLYNILLSAYYFLSRLNRAIKSFE